MAATLAKLFRHDVAGWAAVGGLAVEAHWSRHGGEPSLRTLNDLDFLTESFQRVPASLAGDFLFRHIHPLDPPGKTLAQLVDPESRLRIDVFRAYGAVLGRAIESPPLRIISLEDVVARCARILCDLALGIPVAAKHAADFLRLVGFVDSEVVETAWLDHRKADQPPTFRSARTMVERSLADARDLLITPEYSKDPSQVCERCVPTDGFELADARLVLSLLGYC